MCEGVGVEGLGEVVAASPILNASCLNSGDVLHVDLIQSMILKKAALITEVVHVATERAYCLLQR